MQENGLKWHSLTSVLLFYPAFGAKLLKYLFFFTGRPLHFGHASHVLSAVERNGE